MARAMLFTFLFWFLVRPWQCCALSWHEPLLKGVKESAFFLTAVGLRAASISVTRGGTADGGRSYRQECSRSSAEGCTAIASSITAESRLQDGKGSCVCPRASSTGVYAQAAPRHGMCEHICVSLGARLSDD